MEFPDQEVLKLDENLNDLHVLNSLPHCETSNETTEILVKEIQQNLPGCDLNLCLFMAALNSYKRDRCLRPFPTKFINGNGKNFRQLKEICDDIPPLITFLKEPQKCSKDTIEFLTWLFFRKSQQTFRKIEATKLPSVLKVSEQFQPHYVFEICYQKKTEKTWLGRKGTRDVILAFHGSAIENFHSILAVGLQQHFSSEKGGLYGEGIYLSDMISISAIYAPFGATWQNSILGRRHSIIAVCEIINDVHKVKCLDDNHKSRSKNENSLDEIPANYFVVTDSDMVRLKYLMVYKATLQPKVRPSFKKKLFIILFIIYVFIVIIGRYNNISFIKFTKWLYWRYIADK